MKKAVFCPLQSSLVPFLRVARLALVNLGGKSYPGFLDARDSRHLHRLRSTVSALTLRKHEMQSAVFSKDKGSIVKPIHLIIATYFIQFIRTYMGFLLCAPKAVLEKV